MATISKQRAEKIARNINAMDTTYQYSNDSRSYRFWSNLQTKLNAIISTLADEDKKVIKSLCNDEEAKYFNLV